MSQVRPREDCSLKAGNPLIFWLNISSGSNFKINTIQEFENTSPTLPIYLAVYVKLIKEPSVTLTAFVIYPVRESHA